MDFPAMTLAPATRIKYSLFLSQSFFSAALIGASTLLSIVSADLAGTESAAGIPQSLLTLCQALIAFPLGALTDRFGRRLGISLGYVGGMVGMGLGGLAIQSDSYNLLLLAVIFLGLSRAGSEQARFAVAEVHPSATRAAAIGTVVFAGTLGAIFGPLLVAPMAQVAETLDLAGRSGVWISSAVFMAISLVIAWVSLRPDPRDLGREVQAEERRISQNYCPARPLSQIFRDPRVQLAVLSMLIAQAVMVGLMVMTPLHMNHHDHSDGSISLVIMTHTLGMFGLSGWTGRLIGRYGRVSVIFWGALMLLGSAVLAPLSPRFWPLVLALFLLGLGWNFCFIGGTSLLSDSLTSEERGKAQGINDALIALCAAGDSFGAGLVFERAAYLGVSLAGLLAVLVLTSLIGGLSPRVEKTASA